MEYQINILRNYITGIELEVLLDTKLELMSKANCALQKEEDEDEIPISGTLSLNHRRPMTYLIIL